MALNGMKGLSPEVMALVERLLPAPERSSYVALCQSTPAVIDEVVALLGAGDFVDVKARTAVGTPSVVISVTVQRWIDGAFVADYRSEVRISRVAPCYAVMHAFTVQNRHPKAIDPSLSGSDGSGWIKAQRALHGGVAGVLDSAGYLELSAWDLEQPVAPLLGSRWHTETYLPTVRGIIFDDLFELLG